MELSSKYGSAEDQESLMQTQAGNGRMLISSNKTMNKVPHFYDHPMQTQDSFSHPYDVEKNVGLFELSNKRWEELQKENS